MRGFRRHRGANPRAKVPTGRSRGHRPPHALNSDRTRRDRQHSATVRLRAIPTGETKRSLRLTPSGARPVPAQNLYAILRRRCARPSPRGARWEATSKPVCLGQHGAETELAAAVFRSVAICRTFIGWLSRCDRGQQGPALFYLRAPIDADATATQLARRRTPAFSRPSPSMPSSCRLGKETRWSSCARRRCRRVWRGSAAASPGVLAPRCGRLRPASVRLAVRLPH